MRGYDGGGVVSEFLHQRGLLAALLFVDSIVLVRKNARTFPQICVLSALAGSVLSARSRLRVFGSAQSYRATDCVTDLMGDCFTVRQAALPPGIRLAYVLKKSQSPAGSDPCNRLSVERVDQISPGQQL